MNKLVAISIIIPVYNCAEYLPQCIESLLVQTFRDFEILVVDDGSTDGTYELSKQYEANYGFIRVFQQEHRFAGTARNYGFSEAQGEYVIFLDGDDYFDPHLLEKAYTRIRETNADICCFSALSFNDSTGLTSVIKHSCRSNLVPTFGVFNRISNLRYLYCFTTPAPWTKLFRRTFIEQNDLKFQNTRSANDFCFVHTALSVADKIAVLDEPLVTYRQNNNASLQATQHKDPFAFYWALTALIGELKSRGLFEQLQHTFENTALDFCMYNLRTLSHNPETQRKVFEFLKNEGFRELGLENKPRDYFYVYPASRYDDYLIVQNGAYEDYVAHLSAGPNKGFKARLRKAVRSIIPVRASVFEKSKRDLQKELDLIKEQNRNLEDKLAIVLEELQKE